MTLQNQQQSCAADGETLRRDDALFKGRRALIVGGNPLKREGIGAVLSGWGCDAHVASNLWDVIRAELPVPDVIIVNACDDSAETGVADVASLRAYFRAHIPAVAIGEIGHDARVKPALADCVVLGALFAPPQLRLAVASLLGRVFARDAKNFISSPS